MSINNVDPTKLEPIMITKPLSTALMALLLAACGTSDSNGPDLNGSTLTSSQTQSAACTQDALNWVSAWGVTRAVGTSLSTGTPMPPSDTTVRNIARVSVAANRLRIRLVNLTDQPMQIEAAAIAKRAGVIGAALQTNSSQALTFNCGQAAAVIPPMTESFYTDPVDFAVTPEDHLAISLHLAEGNSAPEFGATWHESYRLPDGAGNRVEEESAQGYGLIDDSPLANPLPLPLLCNGCSVYALRDIEVITPEANQSWVFLGSSSFHGFNTSQNAFVRVSDKLAERVNTEFPAGRKVAMVNRGIGGDTLLNAFATRFEQDVLSTRGLSAVVVWVTNDLGDRSAEEIIETYEALIDQAHEANVKVFCPTWLPAAQSTEANLNGEREKLNTWILQSARCDATVDWATPVTAPGGFTYLPQFNSGDFIHSNDAGHALWSEITPLQEWLEVSSNQ